MGNSYIKIMTGKAGIKKTEIVGHGLEITCALLL